MMIRKGGITRNIEEKNLQEYKDKGYELVEQPVETATEPEPEPPKK